MPTITHQRSIDPKQIKAMKEKKSGSSLVVPSHSWCGVCSNGCHTYFVHGVVRVLGSPLIGWLAVTWLHETSGADSWKVHLHTVPGGGHPGTNCFLFCFLSLSFMFMVNSRCGRSQ